MLNIGIPKKLVLSLAAYYDNLLLEVEKPDEISKVFRAKLGVKQGGSSSPWLFKIYYAGSIKIINATKGVKLAEIKLYIILFADDMMLLSFKKKDIQLKLDQASEFGYIMGIAFNPEKTFIQMFNLTNI